MTIRNSKNADAFFSSSRPDDLSELEDFEGYQTREMRRAIRLFEERGCVLLILQIEDHWSGEDSDLLLLQVP